MLFLCLSCMDSLRAQVPVNSPFTYIGLGEMQPGDLHRYRYRGYTSTAAFGPYEANLRNPSALGRLRATSFDVGVSMEWGYKHQGDLSSKGFYGKFDYLVLAFPIFNPINDILERDTRDFNWGMMLGIKPYSRVGYKTYNQSYLSDGTEVLNSYKGEGGTYKIIWGNGFTYKEFSLGFKLAYILGKMDYKVNTQLADESYSFVTFQGRTLYMNAFNYDLGAQYNFIIDREVPLAEGLKGEPKRYINLGFSMSSAVKADFTQDMLIVNESSADGLVDTIFHKADQKGVGLLPGHIEAGLKYQHNQSLSLIADFRYQNWAKYENPFKESNTYEMSSAYRVGLGFEYVPDQDAINGYFNRVKYFVGAHYGNDPRTINGEQLRDYGVGAGLTLPLLGIRRRAYATFSFFYRHKELGGINENYYGIGFSFKGTDNQWFVQQKYN